MDRKLLIFLCFLVLSLKVTASTEEDFKRFINEVDETSTSRCNDSQSFVISAYQSILNVNPTEVELMNAIYLLDGISDDRIKRSDLISSLLVIKYNKDELSFSDLESEIDFINSFDPCEDRGLSPYVFEDIIDEGEDVDEDKLERTSPTLPLKAHKGNYKAYYGLLHSHTSYSDGKGSPSDAYKVARDKAKLDFFGVTDHAISISVWPWSKKWKKSKKAANNYTQNNKFVAIRGFEWSSPIYGHISVLNSNKIVNCIKKPSMSSFYRWVRKQGKYVFARYNHPGRTELPVVKTKYEFKRFKFYPKALRAMAVMEMFNKIEGIGKYFYSKGYDGKRNFYDTANQKGWMVGAAGGQDNHSADWGIRNDFRVGVWASSLTRSSIVDAYLERRTFASEDKNASLSFKMNGAQMGSRLTPSTVNVEVIVKDKNKKEVGAKITLYRNGKAIESISSSNGEFRTSLSTSSGDYYYALAKQADGDLLISSPIWILK